MGEENRSWIARMVVQLLPDGPRALTLDEIGDVVGTQAVGADLIEALIDHLQALGATISGQGGDDLPGLLREVIACAQKLRAEGRAPSPQNISEMTGLSVRAIRVALLYAKVLSG